MCYNINGNITNPNIYMNTQKAIFDLFSNTQLAQKINKNYELFQQEVASGRTSLDGASSELLNAMNETGYINFSDIMDIITKIDSYISNNSN